MLRFTFPLVLIAAIAAAHASHAQAGGDRYGARVVAPPAPTHAPAPAVTAEGPALRRLSWPGKAELRPRLAPVDYVAPTVAPPPAWTPAPSRTVSAPRLPAAKLVAPSPAPVQAPRSATSLSVAVASPSATETLPSQPSRYGYVGPGREAVPTPAVVATPSPASAVLPSAPGASSGLGAPQPPAYARSYVLAASAPATPQAPVAPVAPRGPDGVRHYSVVREFGGEPDQIRLTPQTLSTAPDMSTPETPEVAPRTGAAAGKAQVNAARLAASAPG